MHLFRNMKTGVKLIASFLIVAIAAGVIGMIGILNISAMQENDVLLYEENTLGVVYSGNASVYYQQARFNAMKMTVASDPAEREKAIASVSYYMSAANDYLMKYQRKVTNDEDRELWHATSVLWAEYKAHLNQALQYVNNKHEDQALAYLLRETAATAEALQTAFENLTTYNTQLAADRSSANKSAAQNATLLMGGILAGGVIIAVLLGLLMTRSITKPVKAAAAQLATMAQGGDLAAIDVDTFSGEFRQIAQNLNDVRTSLHLLLEDSGMLADAAINGSLSTRADASRHQGGYRKIIEGVNETLDAVIVPIQESAAVLSEMQQGSLNVRVNGEYKGDHAIIKNAINDVVDIINACIQETAMVLGELSGGNLSIGITSEYRGDFVQLKQSINGIIDSLNRTLLDINTAADQVAAGTRQVSGGSQEISQGATEQASSLEELTASITQIASQTKQSVENANRANTLSKAAMQDAVAGNAQMKDMQNAMQEINQASADISRIIKVIDDIAFQTNILALNAAVEAARAGIHGKGFAVVAEEVRNLAAKSANAAKETTDLIEGSIKKAEAGTKIANDTAAALSSILTGVEKAVGLVSEIAAASNEQATAITQINGGIEQLSQVVQTNSATAEQAAAASEELSGQADLLKNMVGQFKLRQIGLSAPAAEPEAQTQPSLPTDNPECQAKPDLYEDAFGKY